MIEQAFDPEHFERQGHTLMAALARYLSSALRREGAVLRFEPPEAMLARYDDDFRGKSGLDLTTFVETALGEANHLHHPRYVGHQVTAPLPEAALLELVAALSNNGSAIYEMGPVEVAMERSLVRFMARALGFDQANADGVFTSGGSAGNLTALLAARQAKAGFDVWNLGLHAGPPLAVLGSEQAHYSVRRSLQIAGLGGDAVEVVPVDARFKLQAEALPAALKRARERGRKPIAVVASAGSTATGAYDPLGPIADFCQKEGLWLHVDGAHGASVAISERLRPLLDGVEHADSVVWDAHKMLLMPALVTGVVFRERARSYEAFAQQASYLFGDVRPEEEWFNLASRTLECTKRWLVLPLYFTLARYGQAFFASYIEGRHALARRFAELLTAAPDFELATMPESNIVCFRYRPSSLAAASGAEPAHILDQLQAELRKDLLSSGDFYAVQVRLPRGLHLRTTLIHPHTSEGDLMDLMQTLRERGSRILGQQRSQGV